MYEYKAVILKVVDGDTIDAEVDLGFSIKIKERFRLYNIDAPEMRDHLLENREAALKAKDRVEELILGKQVVIFTDKREKYGRYLADVFYQDEANPSQGFINSLGKTLLKEGLVKKYEE